MQRQQEYAVKKPGGKEFMKNETKSRILEIIEESIANGEVAGANILIRKNGEEVFYGERGMADLEAQKKIGRDTIFRLYSMSKPITAVAVMILVERGVIDLAQPVSDFLPEFANLVVEEKGEIYPPKKALSLYHLLNMTAGYNYGDGDSAGARKTEALLREGEKKIHTKEAFTTLGFAKRLSEIPLQFSPDSSWQYGLCADVLGAVVEVASKMKFSEFLKKNIFEPLGMKDTGFFVPEEKQHRLAKAYETVGKELKLFTGDHLIISNSMKEPPVYEAGGAGLVSTIDDYARFAQMLLNGGTLDGVRIMSANTAAFMTSGRLTYDQQKAMRNWKGLEGFTYANLLRIMICPEQACTISRMGEYGWDGWLGCYFSNFPNEKMSILLMQQKKDAGTTTMTRKIRNVILSESEE